jgi:ATP-binding cassette subfamily F protein 3
MIQLVGITKSFGARALFTDLTWRLSPGRRIGLIGANGAGKTTLFRIISGELEPDSGHVVMPVGGTIGLLPQEVGDIDDLPVLDFVMAGRADLLAMQETIERLTRALESGQSIDVVRDSALLADTMEQFQLQGGPTLRGRCEDILKGMGFERARWTTRARLLSGGWKVRLVLARLLLQRPTLLLMDEPTNHLDVPSLEWLENFLRTYEGTVVIISHDRYLLNQLANETAALELDGLHVHAGGYDDYQRHREERIALNEKQRDAQERHIRQQQEFIDRFRSKATKARQVQSRVKMLEKVERIDSIADRKALRTFRFAEAPAPGRLICSVRGVHKAFGDVVVYDGLDLEFHRGERVALVGPNGAGKSTLLKMLTGRETPDRGTLELGAGVIAGYFGQHQVDELDERRTVLGEMEAHATVDTQSMCRSILGAFLFSGDDVGKRISVLSGGERNRVALARMLLQPSNVLLLDEPTNHLDISSRDALQEALRRYQGTLIFVSHDRHFINTVATRVVHIEDRQAVSYDGDYDYYLWKRREATGSAAGSAPASTNQGQPVPGVDLGESSAERRDRRRREAEFRQTLSRDTRRPRQQLTQVESRIQTAEEKQKRLEAVLGDAATYAPDSTVSVGALQQELRDVQIELSYLFDQWTTLSEDIEQTERTLRTRFGVTGDCAEA